MIRLTLGEFYDGSFADEGYELYVVRNQSDRPLYVGIS